MACRGPDAEGTWVRGPVALGHRRLAIIDLEGGVQPMSVATPTGDVVLVYSGEAYNYVELREELRAAGERFETESDTEVILRGYVRWGDAVAPGLVRYSAGCEDTADLVDDVLHAIGRNITLA